MVGREKQNKQAKKSQCSPSYSSRSERKTEIKKKTHFIVVTVVQSEPKRSTALFNLDLLSHCLFGLSSYLFLSLSSLPLSLTLSAIGSSVELTNLSEDFKSKVEGYEPAEYICQV